MPRHHTIWDAETQQQIDVPFTPEEEAARDAEEARALLDNAARQVADRSTQALTSKLANDSITLSELRELLRLERGLVKGMSVRGAKDKKEEFETKTTKLFSKIKEQFFNKIEEE